MPREWPAPDDRRCQGRKKDGSQCPNYRQHESDYCNAHDGSLSKRSQRHFEDVRIFGQEDEEEERSAARAAAYERQAIRERARQELAEHRAELDNEPEDIDPEDTPLGRKLLRILADVTTPQDLRQAAESRLEQLKSEKTPPPEPAHPGPEVSPEEVQARLRDGWPSALAASRSTDYRAVLGIPDPHGELAHTRRRSRSRWRDIPIVGDRS